MKKQMKTNAPLFLSLLTVCAVLLPTQPRLHAEEIEEKPLSLEQKQEMVQKLFASVPLLPQNLRPFETLAFDYIKEKSTDNGMSWTVVKQGNVIFDVKKGHLKKTLRSHDQEENRIDYETILRYKDKLYVRDGSDRVEISRCDHIRGIHTRIMDIEWWGFWEADNETNHLINDLLSNKVLSDGIEKVIYREGSDEIAIQANFFRFIVNKKTGIIVKKLIAPFTLDGEKGFVKFIPDRFVRIKGMPVPLVIEVTYPLELPESALSKTRYRTTVDEKTLRINEELEPSEFSITFKAGTQIADAIQQKTYTLSAPLNTLDHTDSVTHLDAMLKKAREETK